MPKLLTAHGRPLLAVVATPRFSAAALVGAGPLQPGDVHAWNVQRFRTVEEKCSFVERRIVALVRARRPGACVLGIPLCDNDRTRRMREHVIGVLRRRRLRVIVRPVRETRTAILGRLRGAGPDALPKAIVGSLAPDLACLLRRNRLAGYYWRNAFEAVALGLACEDDHAPQLPSALARPGTFGPPPTAAPVAPRVNLNE